MRQKKVVQDSFRLSNSFTLSEKRIIVNNFTSSAFVRHPFVRLVSAFIDKVVDGDYKNWRKLIMYSKKEKFKVNYMGLLLMRQHPGANWMTSRLYIFVY
jgi:hypothetical protein